MSDYSNEALVFGMAVVEVPAEPRSSVVVGRDVYDDATCRVINEGLGYFNGSIIGRGEHQPLVVTARSEEGAIIGGVLGDVFLNWLQIQVLWVAEPNRMRGIGTRLMADIEREAVKLGAGRAYVDTVEFQAPGFYKKLGYVEFGRNLNFIGHHDRIYLEKHLAVRLPEAHSLDPVGARPSSIRDSIRPL